MQEVALRSPVIVTRESLEMLPVSVEEVYGIRSSGKFGTLEQGYHEMYRLYEEKSETEVPVASRRNS